jgi:hypothetical protein
LIIFDILFLFRNIEEILAEKGETVKKVVVKLDDNKTASTSLNSKIDIQTPNVEIIVEDNLNLIKKEKE